jgi:XTP/dITP diphosphohydrolase
MIYLTLASANPHKHQELQAFFANHRKDITVLAPSQFDDPDETGDTFLANACIKAMAAQAQLTAPGDLHYIVGDDSGLIVDALAGRFGLDPFPGIASNRWLTSERRWGLLRNDEARASTYPELNQALLRMMAGETRRDARCVSALYVVDAHTHAQVFQTEGVLPLQVTTGEPQGTHGFGYDPIMHPVIDGKVLATTCAEWPLEIKNQHSHRGRALQQLLWWLRA